MLYNVIMKKLLENIVFKKIVLGVIFLLYWVFTIVDLFTGGYSDSEKVAYLVFQIVVFLPFTFCLVKSFGPISIFLLIIYQVLMIVTGFISIFMAVINFDSTYIFEMILGLAKMTLGIICITKLVSLLRNKEEKLSTAVVILSLIVVVLSVLSFIFSQEVESKKVFELIANCLLTIQIGVYISLFPKMEIHVFKND